MTDKVPSLVSQIQDAAEAYYLKQDMLITDEQFDRLVDELTQLDPTHPILSRVGWSLRKYGDTRALPTKIQHSLPKYKTIESAYDAAMQSSDSVIISPKIDGMSVILSYDDQGNLEYAVTRGDGENGVDITQKVLKIATDVLRNTSDTRYLRGELYIPPSVFIEHLSDMYANPRNAVSGIINSRGFDNHEHVHFVAHSGLGDSTSIHTVPYVVVGNETDVVGIVLRTYDDALQDFPLDGVVLNNVAYKFQTVEVEGTVDHVEWNLSNRGQLVPVIVLKDPVRLYGTMVSRMHGFHADFIDRNWIGEGAVVTLTKANEIIPYVTGVVHRSAEVNIPETYNGRFTKRQGLQLVVEETKEDRDLRAIRAFISNYWLVKGIADVSKIIKDLNIKTLYNLEDIMDGNRVLPMLQFKSGWSSKAQLLYSMVHKHRKLDPSWFLSSLAMDGVGHSTSKSAVPYLQMCTDPDAERLIEAMQCNSRVAASLRKDWGMVRIAYNLFSHRFEEEVPDANDIFMTEYDVVLTGKFPVKKSVIENALNDAQVRSSGSISSITKYLIVADRNSISNKMRIAESKGIEILSLDEAQKKWNLEWEN